MFNQARGAASQLLFQFCPSFRVAPTTPNAVVIPFSSNGLFRDPKKTKSPTISASPLPTKSGDGDATVEGAIKSVLDLRSFGFWLATIMGMPTTHKAVVQQPTTVTGVTIHYAETGCPAGAGTLAFVASGKTLAWTANGETAGTPVDVTAGGRFTIPSGTAAHGIVVEVAAASLPSADASDTDITVSATLKAHVFPFDLADRPTALLETGHTDIGKYRRVVGALLSKFSYDVMASEQNVDLTVIAAAEEIKTSVWDATPTLYDEVRASGHGGYISNGAGAGLGVVTGGTLGLDIAAKGYKIANQQEGYGLIDNGDMTLSGTLQAVFDGASAWATARANESTRLRIGSSCVVGSDTFALWWDMPSVEINEKSKAIEGKSGLFAEFDWMAHRNAAGTLPLVVLVNDVPTYETA